MRRLTPCLITAATLAAGLTVTIAPPADAHASPAQARPDVYTTRAGHALDVRGTGVLRNDRGDLTTVVSHTAPEHGSLTLNPDGSLRYVPAPGFTGTDTFRYTTTDAVDLYRTHLPPLATIGGVKSPIASTFAPFGPSTLGPRSVRP